MSPGQAFPDTRWSVVLLAARDGQPAAQDALTQLFRDYWYPLFGHLRASGCSREAAEDLLQAFFVHVLEKQALVRADRLKGSFRGFLLGCLKYFLANQRELAAAQKRGGHVRTVSFDAEEADARWFADGGADPSADVERSFDRRWAQIIMERSLAQLREAHAGRPEVFAALKGYLTASDETRYAETAAGLGVTLAFVKTTVHRMRSQLRENLRREVALTVSAPHEIDDELRHLIHVLASD